jgi:ribonucleotide reductase alpha subunit
MHYPSHTEILSKEFLDQYKEKKINWGFGGLGYIIFKDKYARLKPDGTKEEWHETIERCIRGAQKIGAKYTIEEAERLFDYIFNFKAMFSGRAFWQLGTPITDLWMDSLLNCWVTKVSSIDDLCFIFMESMFGGGVGCNVSKEYTFELPRVKKDIKCRLKNTKDADFIVPDSREGWCHLWRKMLESYLITGKSFTYSTICIRSQGEPLKTFGGIAPGPLPLIKGAELLYKILEDRENKKLRTEDIADTICIGGEIVRSGGIRRTAIILGGDSDDISYAELKQWDLGTIPFYRSNSNNSILAPYFKYITDKFWEGYNGSGEPNGLINLRNARRFGRTGEIEFDGFSLKELNIIMANPCGEALLEDKECCNLAELPINKHDSYEEFEDCAKLLYKTQKAIANGPYYHETTNKVVHRNNKLGLGITGICQKLHLVDEWLDKCYRSLRKFDKDWSKLNGYPQSIRLTVVKPSGTLSLLTNSSPGGHPAFASYFIRRVRFPSHSEFIPYLQSCNVPLEYEIALDGRPRHNMMVASFPCKFDEDAKTSKDFTAIDQLNLVKKLQTVWADQAVSVTVYYKLNEIDSIKEWLKENYDESIKTVSFLLHSGHGFIQPPLEEITQDKYIEMIAKIKSFGKLVLTNDDILDTAECSNGVCPIR